MIYVDKTRWLYKLVKPAKEVYFLSRPRRFGKSLTLSTLESIFIEESWPHIMFSKLVDILKDRRKVVILIDEYDKPILGNIGNPELPKNRNVPKAFYSVIKTVGGVFCRNARFYTAGTGNELCCRIHGHRQDTRTVPARPLQPALGQYFGVRLLTGIRLVRETCSKG